MSLRSLVRIVRIGVRQCRRVFPRGAGNPIRPYGADDVYVLKARPPVGNADAPNLVCAVTQKIPIRPIRAVRPMTADVRLPYTDYAMPAPLRNNKLS
jgi:hypothetical protein